MRIIPFIISVFILLSLGSCTYEDGPFSLRSRTKRLSNTWEYVKVVENGVDITATFTARTVEIETDGEVILTIRDLNGIFTILQGTWDWGNHQDRVIISVFDTNTDEDFFIEWIINRLAKDEMHVEEFTNGKRIQYELKATS